MNESSESVIRYSNRLNFNTLSNPVLGVGFLSLALFISYAAFVRQSFSIYFALIIVVITLLGIHPILLFINYYRFGIGKTIELLIFKKKINLYIEGIKKTYSFEDIERIDIYLSRSIGFYGLDFEYIKYFLRNKEVIIVTSLMSNEFYIPYNLIPNISTDIAPLIDDRFEINNSINPDNNRLYENYEKLENIALEEIINSKNYRKQAKIIAKDILEKRKTTHNKC